MAALVPLKDTTQSLDLYEAVETTSKWFSLIFVNISDSAANDAPVVVGKKKYL